MCTCELSKKIYPHLLLLDGVSSTTVSGVSQCACQNNLHGVTNCWEPTGVMGDTWAEGTGSTGSWWWLTEGKEAEARKNWEDLKWGFQKRRGELSTPYGGEELGLLLLLVREDATTWWAKGEKEKPTAREGCRMILTSSSELREVDFHGGACGSKRGTKTPV